MAPKAPIEDDGPRRLEVIAGGALTLLVVAEVNYPRLLPQTQLALFALPGLLLAFLALRPGPTEARWRRVGNRILAGLAGLTCGYMVVQDQPVFALLWPGGQSLGQRAGQETTLDTVVGVVGLVLVLEATRRALGWALPAMALGFLAYAFLGPVLPDGLFPHRGYGVVRVVAQSFLHSQGVFGLALRVMFTYVFLFVLLGNVLQQTGATGFIIDVARHAFRKSPGGAAKVAVLSSGLMGSLSGSAVANAATTGTFTIPMMRSAGFRADIAAGVEAAASSGGALVPPVMGAGAYMMLEIIDPPVTYLQILKAALIPAALYYLSLLLIVHFYSRRIGLEPSRGGSEAPSVARFEGVVFAAGISTLVGLLLGGYTVFRAASLALMSTTAVAALNRRTRLTPGRLAAALGRTARDAVPLIVATASVGIVIGVVTLTGLGTRMPSQILELAQGSLIAALALIMVASIILGMGLPSAVCYLLMATLVGPVLGELGVVPLAMHLFIFYFGLMSMVTPPVALAAYTTASLAGAGITRTSVAAFRFALVGFTLPFLFVFRPELLMLAPSGSSASVAGVASAVAVAVVGIGAFAAGMAGHLLGPVSLPERLILLAAAAMLLVPYRGGPHLAGLSLVDLVGAALLAAVALASRRRRPRPASGPPTGFASGDAGG